ncbi:hypothetical protein [Paraglaciecola psychrophila]|uniref:Uncharacterized protein n=1 Tax=Paraglaciecola psychrophila 170 TaxID=1129794 RepID=K6YX66_9ALTE|nr:hypothetical protein [Paraglaciecola psychrophila]AGH43876.1 hypothetical protein C427_1767 [Paraglaciecola psychrophila 170]GAC37284.1 hypothetical protein GPSY_1655 [Paraglaciecola psychrophila 170]
MQITSNPLSLFSYIGDNNKADDVLQDLAKGNKKDVSGGLDVLESGLNRGAFEETLQLFEKGEVDIDLNLVKNYYKFNQEKLNREVAHLAENFDLGSEVRVTIQDGALLVAGEADNSKALQQYIDKDNRLSTLIQQTAKLSQFVEWGQAKQQAAIYKSEDMPEAQLVDFLKDARLVVTQSNHFIMSEMGSTFYSQGHTQRLIDNNSKQTE